MHKAVKPILFFTGASIIGYALYRYYTKQIDFLKNITYQIKSIKAKTVSENLVSLDITAMIYNASNVEATVKEMYLDVYINDIKVAQVNEVKDINIKPTESSLVPFNFSFNPKKIGQNLVSLVLSAVNAKDIKINMDGYVKVKSAFIATTIPFSYENNLAGILKK